MQNKEQIPAIALEGVNKSFGDTQVLFDINLDIYPGEVHALVGQNGAGKSTVGKIIGGYYSRDNGQMAVFGKKVNHWFPRLALESGIAMIHQELSLVPELTVTENVYLGVEKHFLGILKGKMQRTFAELSERCGFDLDPREKVGNLRIADQQKVEILRALSRNARVIIMDEPTSSLTADEAQRLHKLIAWLTSCHCTVIYVTHFLEHVLAHTDRVSILRDGRLIKTMNSKQETKRSLVEAMLGHSMEIAFPKRPAVPDTAEPPVLEVNHLCTGTRVEDISLTIRKGEIVGLLGLVGSGRSETARAIFGIDAIEQGTVKLHGKAHTCTTPSKLIKKGLSMIPEDRRSQGLILSQNVRENITLPHLDRLNSMGVVNRSKEQGKVAKLIKALDIVPNAIDGDIANYSGGNQQKVLFAKWMFSGPEVVILDEPTRGVDVGAKRRIYELIVELAKSGTSILLISSELEEVLGLAHRGYLIKDGITIDEINPAVETEETVLRRLFENQSVEKQSA